MMEKVRSALVRASLQVATLRNRGSPISKLPEDALYMIFQWCAHLGCAREQLRAMLAISQTCSQWRCLSLSRPLLWSRMDLSHISEEMAGLLSERSRDCPLETSWPILLYSTARRESAVRFCVDNLPRIAQLSLVATRAQLVPWVYDGSAPQIQKVFLQDADAFAYRPLILDRPLFGGQTLHLRHLSLVGIRMPWAAGVYRNLTSLEVRRCNVGTDVAGDTDLCHIFRDSPHLETLVLSLRTSLNWDVGDDPLLAPHAGAARTPLRALRSLTLELPVPYAQHVLASVVLPPALAALRLCLEAPHSQPHLLPTLLDPALLPPALFAPTTRLQVCDCASSGGVQVRGFAGAPAPRWEYGWKHRSRLPQGTLAGVARALHARYALRAVRAVELCAEDGNCQDVGDALPLLAPLAGLRAFRSLTWSGGTLCAMAAACTAGARAPWAELEEVELVVAACGPAAGAVLDAVVAVARACKALRIVHVTLRMPAMPAGEAALVRDMVRRVQEMGVGVVCRRVSPHQAHEPLEPVEEFSPSACSVVDA